MRKVDAGVRIVRQTGKRDFGDALAALNIAGSRKTAGGVGAVGAHNRRFKGYPRQRTARFGHHQSRPVHDTRQLSERAQDGAFLRLRRNRRGRPH